MKFVFLSKPLPEMILPSPIDKEILDSLLSPETWPQEYHAQVRLWFAAALEAMRQKGLTEEEVKYVLSLIKEGKEDELPGLIDFLESIPQTKVELYNFLLEGTGDREWVGSLLQASQLDPREIKAIREANIPILYIPEKSEEEITLAQMCIWAIRQGVGAVDLNKLGLSPSEAVSLFYRQIVLTRGLPFEVKLPNEETLRTFASTEKGEDLIVCKDADDMFERLGI